MLPLHDLVGVPALGYERERPTYKRRPRTVPVAQWRPLRARTCDALVRRLAGLANADPPLRLDSHPETRRLLEEPSPLGDRDYKHREDLLDSVLCAWTAALWLRHGTSACQVLGPPARPDDPTVPTIIAPARDAQRHSAGTTK